MLATACDVLEPWEHGVLALASRYPSYWDYNTLIVERASGLAARELAELADSRQAALGHRRLDVEDREEAARLRPEFEALGWRRLALVWMLLGPDPPLAAGEDTQVQEVGYEEVHPLRVEWHLEDHPGTDPTAFHAQMQELEMARSPRVLAIYESGRPIAFSQLESLGEDAEVGAVFVTSGRRGSGLGTAVTAAATRLAAQEKRNVWICADDEDRAKHLYQRLGFEPVWWVTEFLRPPAGW